MAGLWLYSISTIRSSSLVENRSRVVWSFTSRYQDTAMGKTVDHITLAAAHVLTVL